MGEDVHVSTNGLAADHAETLRRPSETIAAADVAACLRVLRHVAENPHLSDELSVLGRAIARAYKRVGKDRRQRAERQSRRSDRAKIEATGRCRMEPRPAELHTAGLSL